MSAYRDIYVRKIFTSEVVTAGSTAESALIDLGNFSNTGDFGVQVSLSGSGTGRIGYKVSNTTLDADFKKPSTSPYIKSGMLATSGTDSDGKDSFSFSPYLHRYMKLTIEETGSSSSITVSIIMAAQ